MINNVGWGILAKGHCEKKERIFVKPKFKFVVDLKCGTDKNRKCPLYGR
jgi:hypothetical protein